MLIKTYILTIRKGNWGLAGNKFKKQGLKIAVKIFSQDFWIVNTNFKMKWNSDLN